MNTVEEIKAAIEQLDDPQIAELAEWLLDRSDDARDEQISADLEAGKLDHVIRAAELSLREGRTYDLPGSGSEPSPQ